MCFSNKSYIIHFVDDHSRVILASKRADYINANYIDVSFCHFEFTINIKKKIESMFTFLFFFQGSSRKKMYIAAQGKTCICNLYKVSQQTSHFAIFVITLKIECQESGDFVLH